MRAADDESEEKERVSTGNWVFIAKGMKNALTMETDARRSKF